MATINLIHVGDYFYSKSGTSMSSIYVEGTWERYDYGFVQRDLDRGNTVNIRPANDEELGKAHRMLKEVQERRGR